MKKFHFRDGVVEERKALDRDCLAMLDAGLDEADIAVRLGTPLCYVEGTRRAFRGKHFERTLTGVRFVGHRR